jgi:electron transfer flavoprotein beta subunit
MRILALVRQVLDAEENVRVRDGELDLSANKLVLDTMDEYGVEEALRIRELVPEIEVIVMAVGASRCEAVVRSALALGADRGILVETEEPLDVIAVSGVVAKVAQREGVELILCGGQQADWDSQALGPAVAENLNWPQVTWVTKLLVQDGQLTGKHDVDEGMALFAVTLPAVITTQQGLNEPRYPTLPNIMKAKKKELSREPIDSFGVKPKLKLLRADVQTRERLRKILDGSDARALAEQLVDLLRNEAKVIA